MCLRQIFSVAVYEAKILRRSWVFKMFSSLAVVAILSIQVISQSSLTYNFQWNMIVLSCSFPFLCCYLLNLAQGIIVISSMESFTNKKRMIDTHDVFLVRPISNGEYIVGKLLGLFKTIVSLDLITLLLVAFINLFLSESPFNPFIYLFYFVTLLLPFLVFILGICVIVNYSLNQYALALCVLLGFYIFGSFYSARFLYGIFDFMGNSLPNAFSDITGHAGLPLYLIQRAGIFLLGSGFIIFAISLYKRLPNGNLIRYKITAITFILLAIICLTGYHTIYSKKNSIRQTYTEVYKKYASTPKVSLSAQEITFLQENNILSVHSSITVFNDHAESISPLIFYLNPGLEVTRLTDEAGSPVPFERDHQVIRVTQSLSPQTSKIFQITYMGKIDEDICYPELGPDEYYSPHNSNNLFNYGNKYAFTGKDFTLLTPEVLWYPITTPTVNPGSLFNVPKNFTNYTLHVITSANQLAISEGIRTIHEDTTTFKNSQPLPSLSLCIGKYEQKNIRVDSTLQVSLYYFRDNVFPSLRLNLPEQKMAEAIQNQLNMISSYIVGQKFPFTQLNVIEVPVTFRSHSRLWKENSEFIQPGTIFIPEKGISFPSFNFTCERHKYKNIESLMTAFEGNIDEQVENLLFQTACFAFGWNESSVLQGNWLFSYLFRKDNHVEKINPWCIFPMYLNFSIDIHSDRYPIANATFKNMLYKRTTGSVSNINDKDYRALQYLANHSLQQAINDPAIDEITLNSIIRLKSDAFKDIVNALIPSHDFERFLGKYSQNNYFRHTDLEAFEKEFERTYNFSISPIIEQWYHAKQLARFNFGAPEIYEIPDKEFTRYQVCLPVHNYSDADGAISLYLSEYHVRSDGKRNNPKRTPYIFLIKAGSYNEIRLPATASPIQFLLQTGMALNLPTSQNISLYTLPRKQGKTIEEGIFDVDPARFTPSPDEIIVDDVDPGFRIINPKSQGIIQRLFKNEKNNQRNEQGFGKQWEIRYANEYYGQFIKQARFKLVGFSEEKVEWKANIPQAGTYEVFVFYPVMLKYNMETGQPKPCFQYYTVSHADGKDDIDKEIFQIGWNSLGKFRFTPGETTVILNDKAKEAADILAVDAVKWVKCPE